MSEAYDFNALAESIYEQNLEVGWWDDIPEDNFYIKLQLILTEIAEATEGERKVLMDDHLPHRRMGEVELADALIRSLDLAGREGWQYTPVKKEDAHWIINYLPSIAAKHFILSALVCDLVRCTFDKQHETYSAFIDGILVVAESQGYDIMSALFEKVEYNKTRADHKHENRSKENGKKF